MNTMQSNMIQINDDLAVSPRLHRTLERIAGYLGDDVQGMLEDGFSALVRMARDERSRDDDALERARRAVQEHLRQAKF